MKNALVMAARAVGLSRAAFELTREYCDTRVAFGKPVGHFQAVAFTLADRAMDLEAARGLVWRAAWLWDSKAPEKEALLASAYAISFAHEAAMRAGDDAVQLHGGAGFMRDYPVEKLMRDAKQLQLCGMTAEHADQLAAALELGRPVDPAFHPPFRRVAERVRLTTPAPHSPCEPACHDHRVFPHEAPARDALCDP